MGDVYRAFDLVQYREVALKISDGGLAGNPAFEERFRREVQLTGLLDHPALQRELGSGRYRGMPYLVTAFVRGVSLRERLSEGGPISAGETVSLVRKIAEGLSYCHERGIIHRDVKPDNILVTPDGQPVLVDFGLAAIADDERASEPDDVSFSGTPEYMAPELIEGRRGDRRADVYAVGIMMYEMLTGDVPFHGGNSLAFAAQHLRGPVPRLDRVRPGIPGRLAAVVARCLERDPRSRYPGMREVLAELDNLDGAGETRLNAVTAPVDPAAPSHRVRFVAPVVLAGLMIAVTVIVGVLLQAWH